MNTLYLLGGMPRAAKSTIMSAVVTEIGVPWISADAVDAGIRNMLIGDPHQFLRTIEFEGRAEYKASLTTGGVMRPLTIKSTETELAYKTLEGMISHYARNKLSLAIEGPLTVEWVSSLRLPDYDIRAAFVGYTNTNHANAIFAHAKREPHDWINEWLANEGGDETAIRDWLAKVASKSHNLKVQAESNGFGFFDISTQPFDDYITSVKTYLLQSQLQ